MSFRLKFKFQEARHRKWKREHLAEAWECELELIEHTNGEISTEILQG